MPTKESKTRAVRLPNVVEALIPIVVMMGLMIYGLNFTDETYVDAHMPLAVSIVVACIIGCMCGHSFSDMLAGMVDRLNATMEAILILCTVGLLVASFLMSGTIPALIYYGLNLLTPQLFLPIGCFLCAIVGLACGSSWTATATMGIAMLGIGAGLGTGFAGMSAAAVISPMLITFLHIEPYEAVGIALASDVLASAVSAYTYGRNKNLDIRNGVVMMVSVLLVTLFGSWVASKVPNTTMGNFSVFMTLLLGIKFIVKPVMTTRESMNQVDGRKRIVQSVICGSLVGFICGFIGAGGGMMMLLILTGVLGYELKTAVGTSVFIMAFTAFTGAVSHFMIGGRPDLWCLVFCVASTLLWARIAAKFANKATPATLNRATGVVLAVLGAAILVVNYV